MTIVPVNSVSGGTGTYTLAATDSLILGSAGMIYSSADNAITSLGANQFLVLNGTVLSDLKDGVHIEGGSSANMKVTVGSTGSIQAVDDGISIFGSGSAVTNHGTINAEFGIFIGADGGGTVNVVNTGTIIGHIDGILTRSGTTNAAITVINTGLISGGSYCLSAKSGADTMENHGILKGDLLFDAGADSYIGSDGRIFGTIFGGDGNDTFILGNGSETVDGGGDNDVINFAGVGSVHVALDGSFANTGAAAGDEYFGVENISGSRFGDDMLAGDSAANELFGDSGDDKLWGRSGNDTVLGGLGNDSLDGSLGKDQLSGDDGDDLVYGGADNDLVYGGGDPFTTNSDNDRLYGDAGNDTLLGQKGVDLIFGGAGVDSIYGGTENDVISGGAGADILQGDGGSDIFVFDAKADFGDKIIDFHNVAGDNDGFKISHLIGGGLTAGVLKAAQFWSSATNHAHDASDRFIFRTTDATLWFDANGNAAGGAVMVADLQAGAVVTAGDIIIT